MLPQSIVITISALFGLCWGSFLNVVIYRLPRNESVVFPRSSCPNCKSLIRWYQNIPLVSWIVLKRKCANCFAPISWRYPFVELLTGLAFFFVAFREPGLTWAIPFGFCFFSILIAGTFIDLDHWLLPDKLTLPGIVIGFLGSLFALPVHPIDSALGILFGGGILFSIAWLYYAATKKDGLGGGDIKFLAMVGAFLGVKGALTTLIFSSFAGSILGLFMIGFGKKKTSTAIPFGPFLALGSAVSFFFGETVWQWYFNF